LTFYISLESLEPKEADCTIFAKKFCIVLCTTDAVKSEKKVAHFQFFLNKILVFANIFADFNVNG